MENNISDLFEKVMTMQEILGNENRQQNIIEMFNLMNVRKEEGKERTVEVKKNENDIKIEHVNKPALNSIKESIPYLEPKYQKSVRTFIKIMELQTVIEKYSKMVDKRIEESENWQKEMILAIKPHLEESKKNNANMILKIMEMEELIKIVKDMDNEGV